MTNESDKPVIGLRGSDIRVEDIHFRKAYPLQHIEPLGLMPKTEETAALWQFLIMATQALNKVESQTTYEGDEDQTVDLMQLAHSSRKIFGLDNLEGMFQARLIDTAKRECLRCKLPWEPRLDAWFASGGKSYRILDRDADKVGQ